MPLQPKEQEVIDMLRRDRAGKDGAIYDYHIHGNDPAKHQAVLIELQWQAMYGPGEDLTRWYSVDTVSKLCLLKLPATV